MNKTKIKKLVKNSWKVGTANEFLNKIYLNIPIEILLVFNNQTYDIISVKATKFDNNGKPEFWGIYKNSFCWSKKYKEFIYEPMPSSRTESYYKNTRFKNSETAIKYFNKHIIDKV